MSLVMTVSRQVPECVHGDCLAEQMPTGKIHTDKVGLQCASLDVSAEHPSG